MDNSMYIKSSKYDSEINRIIPFYSEFYNHTIDLAKIMRPEKFCWLDTGCGIVELIL